MGGCRYSKVISITSGVTQRREEETKVSCRRRRRKKGGGGLTSYYPPTNPRARDAQGIEKSQNFFPFVSLSFHSYFVMYEGARAYATCWRSVGVKPKRGGQRAVGY